MMNQLSLYSGSISEIPHGDEINQLYGPNPKDYVRIWTELTLHNSSNMPALWSFFLIVIGALLLVVASVSFTMHMIQRRRRKSLRRRVESGEVDLEAAGIKRLTVPAYHVKEFPLFTYNFEPDMISAPPTPISSAHGPMSPRSIRSSRNHRRLDQRSIISTGSIRSKRSSICGSVDTTATNFQPACEICLVRFDHRITIIRELPCGHIFHPECIDEFLTKNSSLCPLCKHCMLPSGYSPKITNGMVRRERAVRRLRERVDFDDYSLESGEHKFKDWGKRLFRSSSAAPTQISEVPLAPVKNTSTPSPPRNAATNSTSIPEEQSSRLPAPATTSTTGASSQDQPTRPRPSHTARQTKSRRTRPRALKLLPTHPEDGEERIMPNGGRTSPSSFARERMREIAARNAPFEDPDSHRAKCKYPFPIYVPSFWPNFVYIGRLALLKVFPGYS